MVEETKSCTVTVYKWGFVSWEWLWNVAVFTLHQSLRPGHRVRLDICYYYPRPTCLTCYPEEGVKQ